MKENRVLAVVNDKEITEDTVLKFLNDIGPQMAMQFKSPDGIKTVVEELINQEMVYLDALENGIDKEDDFIKELDKLKEGLIKQYALTKFLSTVSVTEGEVLDFYNKNKEKFRKPEFVKASHILVDDENRAKDIIDEIKGGLSFEEAAEKYSSCPSKAQGGNLGEFTKGQMVPEFEEAAFNMVVDTISEPIKTQFGYHIIKLTDKNGEALSSFDEVRNHITQQVLGEKQQDAYLEKVKELKQKHKVIKNI